MDELSREADAILDDDSVLEEDKIELLEELVVKHHGEMSSSEWESMVLDLMWKHREKEGSVTRHRNGHGDVRIVGVDKSKSIDWVKIPEVLPEIDWSKVVDDYKKRGKAVPLRDKLPEDEEEVYWEDYVPDSEGHVGHGETDLAPFDLLRAVLGGNYSDELIQNTLEKHNYDINVVIVVLQKYDDRSGSEHVEEEEQAAQVYEMEHHQEVHDYSGYNNYEDPSMYEEEYDEDEKEVYAALALLPGREEKVLCKYFVQFGECLRADCRYSHDLTSRVCRFWVRGACLNGETCAFLHSFPETESTPEPTKPLENFSKPMLDSLEDFPTLGGASGTASDTKSKKREKPGSKWAAVASSNDTQTVAEKPKKRFDFSKVKPTESFVPGTAGVPSFVPKAFTPTAPSFTPTAPSFTPAKISPAKGPAARMAVQKHNPLTLLRPEFTPWVENPHQLDEPIQEYLQLRKESRKHIEMRNKYLNLSADNWHMNRPDAAKIYSNKGQKHQQELIAASRKASDILYNYRDDLGEIFCDLHGLELDTSVMHLENILLGVEEQYRKNKKLVYAISGVGYHVVSKTDMLTKEVKAWLDEWGYEYKVFFIGNEKFGTVIAIDPWSHI
ncbi:Conserved hypothetical protein [Yarrowia lipolytica]|nr:Conserved hypothetical protein [Yarrowia lipolytica]